MSSPSKKQKTLAPITTHWHNRSVSSVASDAATFHSALAHSSSVELKHMVKGKEIPYAWTDPSTSQPKSPVQQTKPLPKLEALRMARQDSGYEAGQDSRSSSRRTSTSSATRLARSPSKRTSTTTPGRPSTKRASRSSPTTAQAVSTSTSSRRPSSFARHSSSPAYQQTVHQPYQFFQFPTLQDPDVTATPPPPPPPATCQYWTSDSTRRLEYAAIDAASRGVRGFFIKLVPDCILPHSSRRTRFHCDDEASDAGSVRRYRLALPEEKDLSSERQTEKITRPSGLKKWVSTWGRGTPSF